MFTKRSSRIRIDRFDRYKKYEIWFDLLEGHKVVSQHRIPARIIINTFKDIALCEERGYSDVMEDIEIQLMKDVRDEMR